MEERVPSPPVILPPYLQRVATPLQLHAWQNELSSHPDPEYRCFILHGVEHGFRIGFDYRVAGCRKASRNLPSATKHPEPIETYLAKERGEGRIIALQPNEKESAHSNCFGVIPKPHQPGRWRLITDLSYHKCGSVNDGIDPALCSMLYSTVDDAVRSTVLANFDVHIKRFPCTPRTDYSWV